MIHAKMEKAVDGWAAHVARALLDVAWVDGAAREARMRSAYGWGWISRIEKTPLTLTEDSFEGDVHKNTPSDGMVAFDVLTGAELWRTTFDDRTDLPARTLRCAGDVRSSPQVKWTSRPVPQGGRQQRPEPICMAVELPVQHNRCAAGDGGGKVVYAVPMFHRVVALDAATGKVAWQFQADGPVDSAPALPRGSCSNDMLVQDEEGAVWLGYQPVDSTNAAPLKARAEGPRALTAWGN